MFPFERLALLYFAALALASLALRRQRARAGRALVNSIGFAALAMAASRVMPDGVRAWLGHGYLLAGYLVPSLLAPTPADTRLERWLVATDRAWRPLAHSIPQPIADIFEVAYLLCYPLVPAAFAVVWTGGDESDSSRFWIAVLASGFACYGMLPWLASRPPRSLAKAEHPRSGIARLNAQVLERASHGLNTFPSGHVAVSVAASLSVWPVSPSAAIVFGVISACIAVGEIGRAHV